MTTFELRAGPEAVGAARHAIEELAREEQLPRVDDLRLLVSELVTNSVLHGARNGGRVHMHVKLPADCVRVEVCDEGAAWSEQFRSTSLESSAPSGGWGLMLVGALADRWGVEVGDETCVWFEISPDGATVEGSSRPQP